MRLSSLISALGLVCIAESAKIDSAGRLRQGAARTDADDPAELGRPEVVLAGPGFKESLNSLYISNTSHPLFSREYDHKRTWTYNLRREFSNITLETPCKNDGFTCVGPKAVRFCHEGRAWFDPCRADEVCIALPIWKEWKLAVECFNKTNAYAVMKGRAGTPF